MIMSKPSIRTSLPQNPIPSAPPLAQLQKIERLVPRSASALVKELGSDLLTLSALALVLSFASSMLMGFGVL